MAMKDRDSNCSSNIFVSSEDVFEDDENSIQKRGTRDKLHRCLNQVWVHTAIVVIVLVQLLIITFLLFIYFEVIQDPPASRTDKDAEPTSQENRTGQFETETHTKDSPVEEAEDGLNAINVVILCVFFTEIFLRIVAKGFSIIHDKLQVFDGAVVLVVSLLYIVLLAADTKRSTVYGVAYLIVLRLWRIGRIYHDITERERRKAERVINTHRKAAKDAEQYARSMIAKLEQQQHEITTLREHIKVLNQNKANSSPALRSVSHHTYTPDDPGTSEDEFDPHDKYTKKTLEMVTVELSNGHGPTPNGSLPSGTPNGSVPNMTPTSSCSYLTGEGTDPDKVSNKFPDLVEQAQGLEVKEIYEAQGQTHELQGNSDTQSGAKNPNRLVINDESPTSNSSQAPDKALEANSQESMSHADNGNYAYSNPGFQPDSEQQGQDQGQTVPESPHEDQVTSSSGLPDRKKPSAKSKYDDFGSTTYLNQDGIPMTDL